MRQLSDHGHPFIAAKAIAGPRRPSHMGPTSNTRHPTRGKTPDVRNTVMTRLSGLSKQDVNFKSAEAAGKSPSLGLPN